MKHLNLCIFCILTVAIWLNATELAYAATGHNPIGTTLCTAVRWFTHGSVGFGLVAVGFCIFGVAMVMNKITWPLVILGFIDATIMFGADWFVEAFGGTACPPA